MLYLNSLILAVIEGVTEFLPISSTGHMILVEEYLPLGRKVFADAFIVVIQLPAVLAVVIAFWGDLWPRWSDGAQRRETLTLWVKVAVAVAPAMAAGFFLKDIVHAYLFNNVCVAGALVVGGVLLIVLEHRKSSPAIVDFNDFGYLTALWVGCFQCLALIPGTSRSAATIIGAILLGASRPVSAKFSFFVSIPTMLAATALEMWDLGASFSPQEWRVIALGSVVSFLTAWAVVKLFMSYIRHHDFKPFGYYRIALGVLVLLVALLGNHIAR